MKNIIKITVFVSLFALVFAGCVKENFDMVPEKIYTVDFEANTTIADFKSSTILSSVIEDDIIIKGTVISSDKYGSFYKEIVIQDSTGGIKITIEGYDLYKKFPVGEMVYVKTKGLILEEPKGLKQLSYPSNGATSRIPLDIARKNHVFRNSGEGKAIVPKVINITDLNDSYLNTLVKFKEVQFLASDTSKYFISPDDPFEVKNGADRPIIDYYQNKMVVRISPYFYNDSIKNDTTIDGIKVPKGNGDITTIYSKYKAYYQLVINSLDGINFNNKRNKSVLEQSFISSLGQFYQKSVVGDNQVWEHSSTYKCAIMSGYDGSANNENEDWLISPAFDLTNFSTASLIFYSAGRKYQGSWNDVTVQISTNYDGTSLPSESGTWTEITDFNKPTDFDFISSGEILMDSYCGFSNVYVAFKYKSSSSGSVKWEIESVNVIAK